jgi:ABC-type branched-subunit amino acid transport system substrate-binding protein
MLINKQTYLYESTAETQAQQIIEFLQTKGENKNMVIFYDDIPRNKNLATLTKQKAEAQGFKILAFEEASVSNLEIIKTILQKYNKFEIGSIFVSSSSSTVAEELVKHIQTEGHTATVVAHESWLRLQSLEYELYEKLNVHIFYPEYLDSETQKILPFKKGYAILTRKEIANNNQYSYVGYEIVHHLAKMWSMAGTQTDYGKLLEKISPYQGKTGDWLQYNKGKQDNQFVPILRFENGDLKIANEPK